MDPIVATLNFYLALGSILLLLGTVILSVDQFTSRSLERYVSKWGLLLAFLLTAAGSVMTLVYSEIFGFIPCGLCWLQRVFLYPQALLLAAGIYIKDARVALYGLVLSVPGALTALYQHYLQMGGNDLIGCPTAGPGADCAKRIMFEFGFMTFPLMSAALFLFLCVLYLYLLRIKKTA
jgi:disulfide bond formation protein DsbB